MQTNQFQKEVGDVVAFGSVIPYSDGEGTALQEFFLNRGFIAAITYGATGKYTLTMEAGGPGAFVAEAEAVALVTCNGSGYATVSRPAANQILVSTFASNDGSAVDNVGFDIALVRTATPA